VSEPGDRYEQEADRVADEVMRMPAPARFEPPLLPLTPYSLPPSLGPGRPLDADARNFFESRFGYDFSQVRVHTGREAAKSAAEVKALAYAVGNHLAFRAGQYAPNTPAGRRLVGHELTHVVQQGAAGISTLQRQEDESAEPSNEPAVAPAFGELPPEPACPAVKSTLGKIAPEKPCPLTNISINGFEDFRLKFCVGSDVFKNPEDRRLLRDRARSASSNAHFFVHAYASQEGDVQQNVSLACHRANRVARELLAAGVPGTQIDIFGKGPTDEFAKGFTEQALQENRVVLVKAIGGTLELKERDRPETLDEMLKFAEDARKAIQSRDYRLAADAYVSRWTCGKIPTLAEAVLRPTIVIDERDPSDPNQPDRREGHVQGLNTIVLSQDIFRVADNPFECAAGRIADLAFHHLVKDRFPSNADQHRGGMFTVELAGLSPCRDRMADPWKVLKRRTRDPYQDSPFKEKLEDCPEGAPPEPLESRRRAEEGRRVPEFDIEANVGIRSGNVDWTLDAGSNRAFTTTPFIPMRASANVTLRGEPSEFSNYEVGYMQTIVKDETVVEYVAGHRVKQVLPVPMRDAGGPGAGAPPRAPWFDDLGVGGPDAAGNVHVSTLKFANTEIRPFALSPGNVVDTASRHVRVVNWLVARRRSAPLDRFETHFLDGSVIDFDQQVDIVGAEARSGTLKTTMSTEPAEEMEQRVMQFTGPVPEELGPVEKQIRAEPPSAEKAGRITRLELMGIIRQIADSLNPKRLGLEHSLVTVKVFFNRETGRLALPAEMAALPGEDRTVRVESPNVPPLPRSELSRELLVRLRKKQFLPGGKDVVVKAEPVPGSKLDSVEVTLRPDPEIVLIERPGVKSAMKEMWRRTQQTIDLSEETDNILDRRGFSLTVYIDREGKLRPLIANIQTGEKGKIVQGPSGPELRFKETCGGTATDPLNDTPLGAIHTHPIPTPPSPEDRASAGKTQTCGVEFYMINEKLVMRFGGTQDEDRILAANEEFFKE
jgi:outer membrane protein OmpA-like peptidoglycan-associated protein